MSTQTVAAAPHPTLAPEVLAFAREQAVEQYLPALVELARQIYPSAVRFDVITEDDPEIENDRHIVFVLELSLELQQLQRADLQQLLGEADYRWHRGVFGIVPAPLVCVFRLSLDLRP